MRVREHVLLSALTTLGVGGPAARFASIDSEADLVELVRDADRRGEPLLVLGGGSNVVIGDAGFAGVVAKMGPRGVAARREGDRVIVDVASGEDWDAFVDRAVDEAWSGIECLSGIPGLVGATPVQNVGAYGQEVRDTIVSVRAYDRVLGSFATLAASECAFGYRRSILKRNDRWIVTGVRFAFDVSRDGGPVRYAELARALSLRDGGRAPLRLVRPAILALRRAKGMVLDPADPESMSAGSFFVNPIVSSETLEDIARRAGERPPSFAEADERFKLAAAWLVERAGFAKGWTRGRAGVSRKHALAIVNRGGATALELLDVARTIRDGVRERFGVVLEPEPVVIGVPWDQGGGANSW